MSDFKFGVESWCWCCENTNTSHNTELEIRLGVGIDLRKYDVFPLVCVEAGVECRLLNRVPRLVLTTYVLFFHSPTPAPRDWEIHDFKFGVGVGVAVNRR